MIVFVVFMVVSCDCMDRYLQVLLAIGWMYWIWIFGECVYDSMDIEYVLGNVRNIICFFFKLHLVVI